MRVKTAELTGATLDWAVAKCEGQPVFWNEDDAALYCGDGVPNFMGMRGDQEYRPSADWAQGGPIIEREFINISYDDVWSAEDVEMETQWGDTPLIAAMRCYVASKLGDQVDIPEKLCP
jgi:hypothetical protein